MLSEEDRRFLLSQAAVRRYRRGHLIFSKGDDATCLFVVLAGEVEIFIVNGCGRTVIANKKQQGSDAFRIRRPRAGVGAEPGNPA
jgi:CRP-like cAMP-binding protein